MSFKTIEAALKEEIEKIGSFFANQSEEVFEFIKPFVQTVVNGGESILITAAKNAVVVGFATPGSGEVKMAAALASFATEVVENGAPYLESQARALIELALQNLKVTQPELVAAAAATPTTAA